MKPYYQRNGITIYCGEASRAMAEWDAGSIDLSVTSPPYDDLRTYNGYEFNFEAIAQQLWRVTAVGGVAVWIVGDETKDGSESLTSFRQAIFFNSLGFNVETMIYEQAGTGAKGCNYLYWQTFEFMFVLAKGRIKTSNLIEDRKNMYPNTISRGRGSVKTSGTPTTIRAKDYGRRSNIWRYSVGFTNFENNINHPAIFPEALARDHIISWSNEGDLICDPMLGSGTTAKMAQALGRRFIGCEISEEYCKIAVERLRQPSLFTLPSNNPLQPNGYRPEQQPLFADDDTGNSGDNRPPAIG